MEGMSEIEVKNEHDRAFKIQVRVMLFKFSTHDTVSNALKISSNLHNPTVSTVLYQSLGFMCGSLTRFLTLQSYYSNEVLLIRRNYEWQTSTCNSIVSELLQNLYPIKCHPKRLLVEQVLKEFSLVEQEFDGLPKRILHGDLNSKNLLVNYENYKSDAESWNVNNFHTSRLTLFNFNHLQIGPQCVELATLILSSVWEKTCDGYPTIRALEEISKLIVQGFRRSCPIEFSLTSQLKFVPIVMKLRLCLSLLHGKLAISKYPDNDSIKKMNQSGWTLLKILLQIVNYNESINEWFIS